MATTNSRLFWLLVLALALAACDAKLPPPPAGILTLPFKDDRLRFEVAPRLGCTLGRGDLVAAALAGGRPVKLTVESLRADGPVYFERALSSKDWRDAQAFSIPKPKGAEALGLFVCAVASKAEKCRDANIDDLGRMAIEVAARSKQALRGIRPHSLLFAQHVLVDKEALQLIELNIAAKLYAGVEAHFGKLGGRGKAGQAVAERLGRVHGKVAVPELQLLPRDGTEVLTVAVDRWDEKRCQAEAARAAADGRKRAAQAASPVVKPPPAQRRTVTPP